MSCLPSLTPILSVALLAVPAVEAPAAAPPEREVVATPAGERAPAWDPRGGFLVYEAEVDAGWSLFRVPVGPEGPAGEPERLTSGAEDRFPAVFPGGTRVVFVSDRGGGKDLWLLELDGGAVRRLPELPGDELFPDVAPDGRTVAFTRSLDGALDLVLLDLETGETRALAPSEQRDVWPRFSPDGARVAFFSRRDTGGEDDELYVVELATGEVRRITERPGHDFCPSWSPDGRYLVAASVDPGGEDRRLRVWSLDGKEVGSLAAERRTPTEPAWSPDGAHIAFIARSEAGDHDVWIGRRPEGTEDE